MEEKNTTMGTTETMEDYKEALEASYRRIRLGDIVTGTVIDVNDQDVTIDFNYYAPGRIPVTELSDDPTYHVLENVAVGDTLTATVVKTDDGAGNMLLSCKDAAEELAWDKLQEAQKTKKVYHVKVAGAVNGGCVAYVEGVRGFIPASKLALEYVEEPADYLNKELDVQVISVDEEAKRVVLSAKELLLAKVMEEKNKKINKYTVGTVMEGTVEQLKDYGAFVNIGDGITGLVHISQISDRRLKHPSQVLKEGDKVKVKIIKIENNKISLSIREAAELTSREVEEEGPAEYEDNGAAATGLGALLKGFKLN
ncbi:S1 RNA-binding domain-containing protein [Firmicutes bacterium AF25-13AC]|nr:S1 RNA-binding domain-containing protein [Firmicutes bacterium AF25-13AC]